MECKKITVFIIALQAITIALLVILLFINVFPDFLKSNIFWVAVGSLGTLSSAIIALASIMSNHRVGKKQRTYKALKELKDTLLEKEEIIHNYKTEDIERIIKEKESSPTPTKEWKDIKYYLSSIERFSVCVNESIFDIDTVNRMGGPFFLEMFRILRRIIYYKREDANRETIYVEFEKMINNIKRRTKK